MVGEDAEAAGEGRDVDLLDVGVGVVHRVRRGEGERHLGHAAPLLGNERCARCLGRGQKLHSLDISGLSRILSEEIDFSNFGRFMLLKLEH